MSRRAGAVPVLMTFLHDPVGVGGYPSESIRYYNRLLRELSQREHIALIDLEADFENVPSKASYFFADGYHPNPRGVAFIAETAAPPLAALLEQGRGAAARTGRPRAPPSPGGVMESGAAA
jgi:lysophospholipase L1-like esterase